MYPIWEDFFVNIGTSQSTQFRIKVGDDVIYSGRSYKRPGATTNNIRINDICADYLKRIVPYLSQGYVTEFDLPTFVIEAYVSSSWVSKGSVQFYNDWSYDSSFNPTTMGLSAPINGHLDARQPFLLSIVQSTGVTMVLHKTDGTTQSVTISFGEPGSYGNAFSNGFNKMITASKTGVLAIDLSQYSDVDYLTIGSRKFDVVTDCGEWVLYYANAYGGWDSFLIEGSTRIADNLTRHTRETEYDNSEILERGKEDYAIEIDKAYSLVTGWLADDESERMHHLLNSVDVYLYNINSGEMMPVILTNTQTEYKTFKGNGGKMVNYTIEATLSQERLRR